MRQSQRYLDPMIVNLLRFFVIAGSIFLFTGGPDYYSPRSYITLWDLGHILFFTIFSYPLIRGDKKTVLSSPHTLVLSRTTAKKIFGTIVANF